MPKISVVMPVYNGEKYLKEAIDSILNQTFSDFEFIIINDCSSDNTESIIKSYNDSRIIYIKNAQNLGVAKSLNKGFDMAKGEYIARMDADDISMPKRFEKQVRFMDKHPNIAVCGSAIERFGTVQDKKFYTVVGVENIKINLLFGSCIYHPTVIMRRDILERNSYRYDPAYDKVEDFELWTRIVFKYELDNIRDVLFKYRKHENQVTQNYTDDHKKKQSEVILKFMKSIGINAEDKEKMAFVSFCLGDFDHYTQLKPLVLMFNGIETRNLQTNFFDNMKLKKYLTQITVACYVKQDTINKSEIFNLSNYLLKKIFYKSVLKVKLKKAFEKIKL